jgi:hypothetical protein
LHHLAIDHVPTTVTESILGRSIAWPKRDSSAATDALSMEA